MPADGLQQFEGAFFRNVDVFKRSERRRPLARPRRSPEPCTGEEPHGRDPRPAPGGPGDAPLRPPQRDTRATQRAQRRTGPERGEDPASCSAESPVAPGEAQAGDLNEAGGNLGGPVDVFPGRDRPQKERPPG